MISALSFNENKSGFQKKLTCDIRKLTSSKKVIVPADKTTNLYALSPEYYEKLLVENISSTYKKTEPTTKSKIDSEARGIAIELELDERIECLAPKEAFITIKDHKPNFVNNTQCRLLNPAKSEIGKISKQHLQGINATVRVATDANQWRNTQVVLKWFNDIRLKHRKKLLQLDIVEFYQSITLELLMKSLTHARKYTEIDESIIKIIMNARKAILFSNSEPWVKRDNEDFDVTMGAYDGAEVCELVGLFLLDKIKREFKDLNFGIYRDDGLAHYNNRLTGPQVEKMKKDLIRTFKDENLRITIETNMDRVDFLDVTLDMPSGKFWPYRKPNNTPLYINKQSNHPPSVKKQLPTMIERRVSDISVDQEQFEKAKPEYERALKDSGFPSTMKFNQLPPNPFRRVRNRKVIWYNPPFNSAVKQNIGKTFLNLIDKHFPSHHKFRPIFNRNTIKISYSCMPNVKSIISGHNQKVLQQHRNKAGTTADEKKCNCQKKDQCPLKGECLAKTIVYQATVRTTEGEEKTYTGLTESTFKERFTTHKSSFTHLKHRDSTALSQHIWQLKDLGKDYSLSWKILKKCKPYQCGSRSCDLCTTEKLLILQSDPQKSLNKKSEIISKCRHRRKFKLEAVT